jgi:amidase
LKTTYGCKSFANNVAAEDAAVVRRLKSAGALILGKSNVPILCLSVDSTNAVFGRTTNSFSKNHVPGGSSGGDAVAVSLEVVPVAVGSDVAGSIRFPAVWNGVYGLKPTQGWIPLCNEGSDPNFGNSVLLPGMFQQVVNGPIAKSLDAIEAFLRVTTGPHKNDFQNGCPSYASSFRGIPIHSLRGAFVLGSLSRSNVADYVVKSIQKAAAVLADAGTSMVQIEPLDFYEVGFAQFSRSFGKFELKVFRDFLKGETATNMVEFILVRGENEACSSSTCSTEDLIQFQQQFWKAKGTTRRWAWDYDFILAPLSPGIAPTFEELNSGGSDMMEQLLVFSSFVNVAGLPSLGIPSGLHDGLPFGFQIIGGKPFTEAKLLRVADVLASAFPLPRATFLHDQDE